MHYIYCGLIGYLIGSVNPSYFTAKCRGFDIRAKGSGNAGASNALILFGKTMGAVCALLDIAKAYLALLITRLLFPAFPHAFAVTATFCVLGHIFPFYMGFRGGKGLACIGGMVLFYDWRVFLLMLAAEILVVLITDYICFVPITASFAFPVVYGILERDWIGAVLLSSLFFVVLAKHLENLARIRTGNEMHISYLWNPEEELARITENLTQTPEEIQNHFSG